MAILGGGVAGLTAAHELAERGFEVTVYERKALGGKARSIPVRGSGAGGRRALPGEHGFRFFPGFYWNLGDTMRRIPYPGNPRGVHQNLVRASTYLSSRSGGRPDATIPLSLPAAYTPQAFVSSVAAGLDSAGRVPPDEAAFYARRLWVYVTSCDERRLGQWEYVSWSEFTRARESTEEYRKLFTEGLTRNLAATKSDEASTHSIGLVGEASVWSAMGRGNEPGGTIDRVLDGPTSEAFIDPWIAHLRELGVRFRVGWAVRSLRLRGGRIREARVQRGRRLREVEADWFVVAMPVERTARLLSRALLQAAPRLEGIRRQRTDWMNGLMFYLRRELPLTHGHVNYVDSPWAVTSISQAQFWSRDFRSDYGDGQVADCLSTIVSDWVTPGILYGKAARDCTPAEIAAETWAQMKAHLNDTGEEVLTDALLHSWFLDPAILDSGTARTRNDEPLFIQPPGSWDHRPDSATEVPNLFLAGDWVRTNINVTTMEGANEGGRQAVNALLDAAGSDAQRCALHELFRPPELEGWKQIDRDRYRRGLPNLFDDAGLQPGPAAA